MSHLSNHPAFCNFTDHFNAAYFGSGWVMHCVHPVVHLAMFRMLKSDNAEMKKAAIDIVNAPWYPGIIGNHIETGVDILKNKLWDEMDVDQRSALINYSRDLRFDAVGCFQLEYLEARFNARTPKFATYRQFYNHLKHTDHAWLYQIDTEDAT